jgi:hypothetical protein
LPEDVCTHPGLAPFARRLAATPRPGLATLNDWARERRLALPDGRPLRFAAPAPGASALDYEHAIARDGAIPSREGDPHDVFNALMWLLYPRTKAALNALHVASAASATPNSRSRVRDAATLLDESGVLLACVDADLLALLRAHAWRGLFWERRDAVAQRMRPSIIGHGLAVKLLQPFRAITAKALILPLDPATLADGDAATEVLDAAAATLVAGPSFAPSVLAPLPVAALPGWDCERLGERLFDDVSVFRPRMLV